MIPTTKLIVACPLLLCLVATPSRADEPMTIDQVIRDAQQGIELIGNDQLLKRIEANPKLVLIDVRTQEEFAAGHLKGAVGIERGVLEFKLARTLRDASAEIVVYCKKGNRTALAVKALKRIGYKNVKGHVGFDRWVDAGLPFVNILGEAKMIKSYDMNAATFAPVKLHEDKK